MMVKSSHITAKEIWFAKPRQVEVRKSQIRSPEPGEVIVSTQYSAVSAGSELLVYRGEAPNDIPLDSTIESLQSDLEYPLRYGYSCVGEVVEVGSRAESSWKGRKVLCFHPHASHFLAKTTDLLEIPEAISLRDAIFLPNMETAISLAQDGKPLFGESVVILGQGIVGLLLSELMSKFPLASLVSFEKDRDRCDWSKLAGVNKVFNPDELTDAELSSVSNADLIYEVSGRPEALNLAIKLSGFSSRIVIGSWYGNKASEIQLGSHAHRNRLQLVTSQVSTIEPDLTGRWDKKRRIELVWNMIDKLQPSKFITHLAPISEAPDLYKRLSDKEEKLLQVVFKYDD